MRRWHLVRGSTDDPENLGFYQAYGPEGTPIEELLGVCQDRWAVEECFAEAKSEVSLDHYEVRRWDAWHRHVTLCLLAHAFLALVRLAACDEEGAGRGGKGGLAPELIPPTVLEARILVLAMAAPKRRRCFLLGWSAWRRAHQAVAARRRKASLTAKRAAAYALREERSLGSTAIAPEEARLTDEQWILVRPLLPPQRGGIGRPPNDHHHTVLGGILWVTRTGSSWREMPEEYGKWETAYRRYELWVQ